MKQMRGLDRAMASLGTGVSDTQINSLTEKHTLDLQKMEMHYKAELEILERRSKTPLSNQEICSRSLMDCVARLLFISDISMR